MFKKLSLITLLSIASLSNAGIWNRVAGLAARTTVAFRNAAKPATTQAALAYIAQPTAIQRASIIAKEQAARITPVQATTLKTFAGLGLASIALAETGKFVERANSFTKNGGVIISQTNLTEAVEAPVAEQVVAEEAPVAIEPVVAEEAPIAKVSRTRAALNAAQSAVTSVKQREANIKKWTNDTRAAKAIRNATYGAYGLVTDNRLVNWFRSKKSN
ncbi:hypothetical protein A3F66_01085 [candidate division TM6 bacterium RIFCSPHIGHO2_12_FULL_32_22]|nr:MAG: hypothetical protein A3F66_01085 [candidate division TM6 bacterium RIFCSPHIGHO2_12_FULL_32_22]